MYWTLFLFLSLAPSCDGPPEPEPGDQACEDLACRVVWMAETWASDPELVVTNLESNEDPLDRAVLIRELTERDFAVAEQLCGSLKPRLRGEACARVLGRPHLSGSAGPPNRGRRFGELVLAEDVVGPYQDVEPIVARDCEGREGSAFIECQHAAAVTGGDPVRGAGHCAAIPETKWRDECVFRAAEHAFERKLYPMYTPGTAEVVAGLCLSAGTYAVQCSTHIITHLCAVEPAPDRAGSAEWRAFEDSVAELVATMSEADPTFGASFHGRVWDQVFERALTRNVGFAAGVASSLPDEALPHLRAAAAARLARLQPDAFSLEADLERIRALLEGERDLERVHGLAPDHGGGPRERGTGVMPLAGLPSVLYFSQHRRALGQTADDDALVCLLEAYGRAHRLTDEQLATALSHPAVAVRWTAVRYVPEGPSGEALRALAAADESPAVRDLARLAKRPGKRRRPADGAGPAGEGPAGPRGPGPGSQ